MKPRKQAKHEPLRGIVVAGEFARAGIDDDFHSVTALELDAVGGEVAVNGGVGGGEAIVNDDFFDRRSGIVEVTSREGYGMTLRSIGDFFSTWPTVMKLLIGSDGQVGRFSFERNDLKLMGLLEVSEDLRWGKSGVFNR